MPVCRGFLIYLNKSSSFLFVFFCFNLRISSPGFGGAAPQRNAAARHGGAGGAVWRAGTGGHGGAAAAGLGAGNGAGQGGDPEKPSCPPAPRAAGSPEPGCGGDGAPGWPRGGGVGGEPLLREVSPQDPGAAQVAGLGEKWGKNGGLEGLGKVGGGLVAVVCEGGDTREVEGCRGTLS